VSVAWAVNGSHAALAGGGSVPLEDAAAVTLLVTFVGDGGATVTYRQEATVGPGGAGAGARLVWPPETYVCRLTTDCGLEGTYVPGGDYVEGVAVEANVTTR
jgi:hypothetical protein